ncbi:MAG: hypothetical protein J5I90_10270 [Caldilineales bacterium]|nr:hypothetical protein [Caldilineales bacterium]
MALIKIVGVCGSGKTTLARALQALGYDARQVSQEHSGVPDLWRRRLPPDVLIYLDASGETARTRYPHLNLHDAYLDVERKRLAHARAHADCLIHTDGLTAQTVLTQTLDCLKSLGFPPSQMEDIPT